MITKKWTPTVTKQGNEALVTECNTDYIKCDIGWFFIEKCLLNTGKYTYLLIGEFHTKSETCIVKICSFKSYDEAQLYCETHFYN